MPHNATTQGGRQGHRKVCFWGIVAWNNLSHFEKSVGLTSRSSYTPIIGIGEKIQSLEKGEWVDKSYSTRTLNPSSSAAPTSTSQSLYSMPSNYFAGQSPPPCSDLTGMAEPIRLVRWWPAQQHQHRLCQLFLRLVLAEQMNW